MEKPKVTIGPFRATKLWNTIISDFRSGIPLKRHRWRMRYYDNCFTTTEAVDWLHDYLCNSENFGPWVTKSQVVTLLDKFVHSRIIEEVKSSSVAGKPTFEDNGHLYKFLPVSPMKKLRSALTSRSSIQSLSPSPRVSKSRKSTRGQEDVQPLIKRDQNVQPDAQENRDNLRSKVGRVSRPLSFRDTNIPSNTHPQESGHQNLKASSRPLERRHSTVAKGVYSSKNNGQTLKDCQQKAHSLADVRQKSYPSAVTDTNPADRLTGSVPYLTTQPLAMRDSNVDVHPRDAGGQSSKDLPRCTLVTRPLTTEQIEEVWKSATLKRLQRLLWLSTLDGLLDESIVVPADIIHNCTHINRNGVVQLLSKENDLPHWVISAMRCLANWPNKVDSELPSYPGFERDVFKTVSNYFQNLPEPLITYNRYDLIVEAFVSMECRDRGIVPGQDVVIVREGGLTSFQSVESLMFNMTTGGRNSSTNTPNMDRKNPYTTGHDRQRARRSASFNHMAGMMQPDTPRIPNGLAGVPHRTLNKQFGSVDTIAQRNSAQLQKMRPVSIGTRAARSNPQRVSNAVDDYGFANMPPSGRPKNASAEVSSVSDQSDYEHLSSAQTLSRKCSSMNNINVGAPPRTQQQRTRSGLFASKKFGSATELFNRLVKKKSTSQTTLDNERKSEQNVKKPDNLEQKEKLTQNLEAIISPGLVPPPSYPVYNVSPSGSYPVKTLVNTSSQTDAPTIGQHSNSSSRISPPYPPPLRATLSLSEISQGNSNTTSPVNTNYRSSTLPRNNKKTPPHSSSTPDNSAVTPTGMPSAILGPGLHSRMSSDIKTSTPFYQNLAETANGRLKRQDSIVSISSLYLTEDKSYCQEALRLCLLLLPPPQRRALHLLLRVMSKMENNMQLALATNVSTRHLLLQTFSRCILRCAEEVDLDESLAMRIVEYFLDNHTTLFAVPQELRDDIEERLTYLKRSQIKYEPDAENIHPSGFCAKISVEEFEEKKTTNTQQAIEDLLDNIIADTNMSSKDKKKKLKLFQKAYPEIYQRRLPNSSSEAELLPSKPKIKQPMLNVKKSLAKLKPIR